MKTPIKSTTSKLARRSPVKLLTLAAALAVPTSSVLAQSFWSGGTSDFNNSTSWSGTYIGGNDNCSNDSGSNNVVLIKPGDAIWTHGDTLAGQGSGTSGSYLQTGSTNITGNTGGNWMRLGIGTGSAGYYTLSNGTVSVTGQTHLGENGNGYLEIDGGTYNTGYNGNPGLCAGDGDGNSSSPVGTLNLNGGTINNINNETWFGEANSGAIGYFNMTGGTFNANNWFVFGRNGGQGYGVMTAGTINFTGGGQFLIGGGGIGSLTQSGGTINVQNQYLVPQSNGSGAGTGTNNLSGTAVVVAHDWIAVGRNSGYGELNISGNASLTRDNGNDGGANFDVGAGGPGVVNQNGGAITNLAGQTWIGENSTATWNLNSGIANLGTVHVSQTGSGSGKLYLNGGTLIVQELTTGSTTAGSAVYLNGGSIIAAGNNATFMHDLTVVQINSTTNIVFDSQAFNISLTQEIDGNSGITKNGSGTMSLMGPNTYSGNTIVNAGTLIVGTSAQQGGVNYTVADTGGFGVAVQSSGTSITPNNVTLGGATGGTLNFNLGGFGNPGSAPLNIGGTLTANGTFTVNISATVLSVGTIPLMQWGTLAGSQNFVLGTLPSGVAANLQKVGNVLQLVVTSAVAPRWNGNVVGIWDTGGANQDWFDLGSMTATTYSDPAPVIFDDNASGTTTVNVTNTVSPFSINFNNNSLPYTLVGPGKINGSVGVNLNGTASVALLNTGGNTFTGPVVINSGTLNVTNLANGGSPSPLGSSSASSTNLVIGGTLSYSGAPVVANRGFTVNGTNSTIDAEGNLTLGGSVAATPNSLQGGTAQFSKVGPAQLTLKGTGTNQFSFNSPLGMQVIAGTMVFDGSAGAQVNHVQNQLYIGDTTAVGASLVLTNTTVNVDSWLALGRINGGINNTSTLTLYNSALNVGNLSIGWDGGQPGNLSSQFVSLNGTSSLTNFGAVNLNEGAGSTMTLNLNDSSVFWVQNPTYIASANPSTGTVVVANSALFRENNGWFDVAAGANSIASLLIKNNATVSISADFNLTDTGAGANGVVTVQDNATLVANNLYVGKAPNSTATLNITGNATVTTPNGLTMSTYFDGTPEVTTATVNLNGGSLSINLVQGNTVASVNYGVFNFNGGKLIFHPPFFGTSQLYTLAAANVLAGGAVVDTSTNSIGFSQALLGSTGDGGLTKLGTGTLYLNAVNTYTNLTTVSAGTLAGSGSIAGSVNVASGASLGAGAVGTVGTLTINGKLTLAAGSTASMKVASGSNDLVAGLTAVSYSGALVVTNTSGVALAPGVYQLFNSATAGTGNFTSVAIVPAGSGTGTFNPATGQLTIVAPFAVNPVTISGGNLILTGTGGTVSSGYTVLSTTNLTTPLALWTTNTTGTTGSNGSFSNAIPVSATTPAQFFRVRQP